MGVEFWIPLLSAIIGGGGLVGSLLLLPKIRAEARKLNADASKTEWENLKAEVDRLTTKVDAQAKEIANLKQAAADEKAELERENRALRAKVSRLENRIKAMETVLHQVFKVDPNTEEFNDLIRQADEAEARSNGEKN